jgi:hypothetical protein
MIGLRGKWAWGCSEGGSVFDLPNNLALLISSMLLLLKMPTLNFYPPLQLRHIHIMSTFRPRKFL